MAEVVVLAATVYGAVGVLHALVFVLLVAPRLDPSARAGSILFRVVILPAATLLWPLVLVRSLAMLRQRAGAPHPAGAHGAGKAASS